MTSHNLLPAAPVRFDVMHKIDNTPMQHKYYYACSYPLGEGSIINPGNWARILQLYTPSNGNPWLIIREKIYEEIRVAKFPDKPSRFQSLFLCESRDDLLNFMKSNNRLIDIPYEVELIEDSAITHRGCLIIQNIEGGDNQLSLAQKAEKYWRGEDILAAEILTKSPIRILSRINV